MAATLEDKISYILRGNSGYYSGNTRTVIFNTKVKKMMEIPVGICEGDTTEIPIFAARECLTLRQDGKMFDMYVAHLKNGDFCLDYKSLDARIRGGINGTRMQGINKLYVLQHNNNIPEYMISEGVIYDAELLPLIMFSLEIGNIHESQVEIIRPIVRISPKCYEDVDSVKRYITGKLLAAVLKAQTPFYFCTPEESMPYKHPYGKVRIVIEEMPWLIRSAFKPKVNEGNDALRKVVYDAFSRNTLPL